MHKAIELLMSEHRLIERVLDSLETFGVELAGGLAPERAVLADYGRFFREFADSRHHAKEEQLLFRRMVERGFPREDGPIAVMLHEHDLGRGHVAVLAQAGAGSGALAGAERRRLEEVTSAFVPMLRAHILKEDRILYPMALRLLGDPDLDELAGAFEALDRRLREDGSHERQQLLAERLCAGFRPDPGATTAVEHPGGCCA